MSNSTSTIQSIRFISFRTWKKKLTNEELEKLEIIAESTEREPCSRCNASGEHECTCGQVHDCNYCDGTGYKVYEENDVLFPIYLKECAEAEQKLLTWLQTMREVE